MQISHDVIFYKAVQARHNVVKYLSAASDIESVECFYVPAALCTKIVYLCLSKTMAAHAVYKLFFEAFQAEFYWRYMKNVYQIVHDC